jgi:hypothetical protein
LAKPIEIALRAQFDFDREGRILGVSIAGDSLANGRKNERIRDIVNAHRDWSDRQVVQALKKQGAKYGPDDRAAFLAALPLAKLEPFLGNLRVRSVEFSLRHDQPGGSFAELWWNVETEVTAPNGELSNCSLNLEPFEGKLILLRKSSVRMTDSAPG